MSLKLHLNKKRILYAICFALFCLIDQRSKTCSGLDGWLESFRDLTGVVMAVVIMSHYRVGDFMKRKLPYLAWSLAGIAGGVFFCLCGQEYVYFLNDRIVITMDVFFFGHILIHTFIDIVMEKKRPKLNKWFACAWLFMMLWMIVSRSEYIWPLTYLIMFGCFYLTDYTKEEQEDLFQGMLDGVILAFFLIQGWAFVFRPYDVIRYKGAYNNCNLNALFYCVVLAAAISKLIYTTRKSANKWIRLYYWLGIGVTLAFLFMTIGRTGWMTGAVLVLVGLLSIKMITGRKNLIKNCFVVVLCFCLMFPLVFGAVRYLPPAFHHPVWFFGEWRETRVHSWDKWDSEKFVDLDELLKAVSGRIGYFLDYFSEKSALTIRAKAAEATPEQMARYEEALWQGYALGLEYKNQSIPVRKAIYKYYIDHLNLFGHPYSEQGFQLWPTYWIGHAHNIYLQYGTDFGIPVLVLFVALIIWASALYIRQFLGNPLDKPEKAVGSLLFLLVPAVFGLFEYCWGVGSLSITLLFIVWRRAICYEKEC